MIAKLTLTGCLIACAALAAGGEFEVKLSVTEPGGVARKAGLISGGIPLPAGKFKKDQSFAVFKNGKEIPCQVVPLVVETDGTLSWVLVDFQDDLGAKATNRYVLKAIAPRAKPASTLKVTDTANTVTVDTGRIGFTLDKKKPFSLFSSVSAGGPSTGSGQVKPVVTGGEVSYVQMQGRKSWDDPAPWKPKKLVAGVPDEVRVFYRGPMRVTIEVRGHFADDPLKLQYRAWITAWAGRSRVEVKYKLCNSNPDHFCVALVGRSGIALRMAGAGRKVLLGAEKVIETAAGGGEVSLHQGLHPGADGAARARADGKSLWSGKAVPGGWVAVTGKAGNVFVCDRLFYVDPARRLAFAGDRLVLESVAQAFDGKGRPWHSSDGRWLVDCSHHTSEYVFDFAAPGDRSGLSGLAGASRGALHVRASGQYYSSCERLSVGRFGTVAEEKACYDGWTVAHKSVSGKGGTEPHCGNVRKVGPVAFVRHVSNHGDSEGDSTEGTLLMYLRTGDPGWLEYARAWARYHADLHVLRTDGWKWKDGECHFRIGMRGCHPVRKPFNFKLGKFTGRHYEVKLPGKWPDAKDLGAEMSSQMCACHLYGTGLADFYCLTGDRDALVALVDQVRACARVFNSSKKLVPGRSEVGNGRVFTRAFMVVARALEVDPGNEEIGKLCRLFAASTWQSPILDERGVHMGYLKKLPRKGGAKEALAERGLKFAGNGKGLTISDPKTGRSWRPKGTVSWQNVYGQTGADICARHLDDENMRDYTVAFAGFAAKYQQGRSGQTEYYASYDLLGPDCLFDTGKGIIPGGYRGGYFTRFYVDVIARGYSWTGERRLLERARDFWQSASCNGKQLVVFATHIKTNHDYVLHASRLFHEWAHPRRDAEPPKLVADLNVTVNGAKASVSFTAPGDRGGGRPLRYQVKCSELPIASYEEWSRARDLGKKRNWWRAVNLDGEPRPKAAGTKESFTVTGVPANAKYFALRSFDDSWNRSAVSNVATAGK